MQEDVEHRTVTLAVSAAKFTGRELKDAISRFMQHQSAQWRSKEPAVKSGRVTMRQLQKQYGELRSVNIDDNNSTFVRYAKGYLLTSLFNSTSTMDNDYTMKVRHDFYGR